MADIALCHRLPLELLTMVFTYLGAGDLTSCAVTCKRWSAPAIHTKWSTLWVPLEALLGAARPPRQSVGPQSNAEPLNRYEHETDWELLKCRTTLVSRLYIGTTRSARSTAQALRHTTLFLPNIRELSAPYLPAYEEALDLVLSPSLKSVELRSSEDRRATFGKQTSLIKRLAETVPSVEKLIVRVQLPLLEVSHLWRFSSLRMLQYFGLFGYAEWEMLAASSPELQTLVLGGSSLNNVATKSATRPVRPLFPTLEALDMIDLPAPKFIVTVLRNSGFPKLRKVALPIEPAVYPFDQYIRPLVSGASGMEEFTFEIWAQEEDSQMSLACLADFATLSKLRLIVFCNRPVGQNLLLNIPHLLPDLLPSITHLTLRSDDDSWKFTRIVLSCDTLPVASLRLKLPALQSLEISLDADSAGIPHPSSTFPAITLLTLNPVVFPRAPNDYDHFAANLAILFPTAELSSESVIAFVDTSDSSNEFWDLGTEDDLKALQMSLQKAQNANAPSLDPWLENPGV